MLTRLVLRNFRCFLDHTIEFGPLSVVVGANNAGKTTIAEALRVVSIVSARYISIKYDEPPGWLDLPIRCIGCKPSLEGFQIRFESLFHRYSNPPAMIRAEFEAGTALEIYIRGERETHAVIYDHDGRVARSKAQARAVYIPRVSILPQVAPLSGTEYVLRDDYIRASVGSSLSPLHFRNQLRVYREHLEDFRDAVEATWPGLQIWELDRAIDEGNGKEQLYLQVRDGDFVGELSSMGHGLQMWMQTIWFLTRCSDSTTVVLDEPDVYMHADLQRRLIQLIRTRFPQVLIMTHSTEIITEVQPGEVVVVDRQRSISKSIASLPAVQRVVSDFGSVHNIGLARLWTSRVLLIVEGDDLRILREFWDKLFPGNPTSLNVIPSVQIGGWGGWNNAMGCALLLHNAVDERVRVHCIFDSDYHTPEQIGRRKSEAADRGITLHVWSKKEIENYLLVPSAIARFISGRIIKGTAPPTEIDVAEQLDLVCSGLSDQVFDGFAQEFLVFDRKGNAAQANRRARSLLEQVRGDPQGMWSRVSAKRALSELSAWSQSRFGVSLSAIGLARAMDAGEIHSDVSNVLRQVEADCHVADTRNTVV